jgi:hypothetical protein
MCERGAWGRGGYQRLMSGALVSRLSFFSWWMDQSHHLDTGFICFGRGEKKNTGDSKRVERARHRIGQS